MSCLGPTFAEFYKCHLKNVVFAEQPSLKPNLYVRYVRHLRGHRKFRLYRAN